MHEKLRKYEEDLQIQFMPLNTVQQANQTYFLKSQIRTLSDAATYKLPEAPKERAVTGVSPACVRPKFAVPFNVFPDEHKVFTAFV